MRASAAVILALWFLGCRLDDSAPPSAQITCRSSVECPAGWRCSPLRGRCVLRSDDDTLAPGLAGSVSPTLVRPGETVTVTVTADEALSGPALVEVRAGSETRPVEEAEPGVFRFVVPAGEPDRLLTFFGRAEDLAGNGTQGVVLGAALVDGTPPAVNSTSLTPTTVVPGGTALLQVTFTEEVRPGVRLRVLGAGGGELLTSQTSSAGAVARFDLRVPAGTPSQDLALRLDALLDPAGNAGPEADAGVLLVDGDAPLVGALGLSGRRYSAQPGYDEVVVPIAVSGATSATACVGADCRDALGRTELRFPVTQGPEGVRLVTVRAEDDVGLRTDATDAVYFDFTAPQVQAVRVEPARAQPGTTVAVTATFDEVLGAGAQLVARPVDGGTPLVAGGSSQGDRVAGFDLQLPANLPSQAWTLSVEGVVDLVANAAAAVDAGTLVVDADPPTVAPLGLAGQRFSREPGFDDLAVPVLVSGADAVLACVDTLCVDARDAGTVHFRAGDFPEGTRVVRVRATDLVGHVAEEVDSVVLDFTAPTLQDLQVTPVVVGPGGAVAITAAFDEPLAAGARLTWAGPDGGWSGYELNKAAGGRLATFNLRLPPASLPSGEWSLALGDLADEVGNAAALVDAGTFRLDADPPVFLAWDAGFSRRYSAQAGFNQVRVPTPPVSGAVRVEVCLDQLCQDADGGLVTFGVDDRYAEGPHPLLFRATDEVGNQATRFDAVTLDFTAPTVLSAELQYRPPAGCPLPAVSALGPSGQAEVRLIASEPLQALSIVDAGALQVTIISAPRSQGARLELASPPAVSTGTTTIRAVLEDDVGNWSVLDVAQVRTDGKAPPVLDGGALDQFLYRRVPHGAASTGYAPSFSLGADAGTFEPGTTVQVWTGSNTSSSLLIATLTATDAGALPLATLPPVDYQRLYYRQFDPACNPGTAAPVPVPRVEWVVTLGGKVPGQTAPNPHRFLEAYNPDPGRPVPAVAREWGDLELSRVDDAGAVSRGPALAWQSMRSDPFEGTCALRDPVSGVLRAWQSMSQGARAARFNGSFWTDDPAGIAVPGEGSCALEPQTRVPVFAVGTVLLSLDGSSWVPREQLPCAEPQLVADGYFIYGVCEQGGDPATLFRWNEAFGLEDLTPQVTQNLPPGALAGSRLVSLFGAPAVVSGTKSQAWVLTFPAGTFAWADLPTPPDGLTQVYSGADAGIVVVTPTQTWLYDGTTWQAGTGTAPVAPQAGYDDATGAPVVVDRRWGQTRFDPATRAWSKLTPGFEPTTVRSQGYSVSNGSLASDPTLGRVVFHANLADAGGDVTWYWDGYAWGLGSGVSPPSPGAVVGSSPDGGAPLMLGGQGPSAQTWRLAGTTWQALGGTAPSFRVGHALAADALGRVLLFGGQQPLGSAFQDAWAWTGSAWTIVVGALPPPRARHAMAYDPLRQATVVFGGTNGTLQFTETWEWTPTFGWLQPPQAAPAPPGRLNPGLAWDPVRQVMVLSGGAGLRDTWRYDGTWTELSATVGQPRGSGPLAWDSTHQALMSFSDEGLSYLLPAGRVGQQLVLASSQAPQTAPWLQAAVSASFRGVSAGALRCEVWAGTTWVPLPDCGTQFSIPAAQLAALRTSGILRVTTSQAGAYALETDYVELTVRYQPVD